MEKQNTSVTLASCKLPDNCLALLPVLARIQPFIFLQKDDNALEKEP